MVTWTLESNACDVLGLGPRAAGRLATVGVRTVKELLAASPQAAADRQFSVQTIAGWQREARLLVSVPDLPAEAARLLAAIEIASAERLACSTPTELMVKIEALWRDQDSNTWLRSQTRPTMSNVCEWISCARHHALEHAA